MPVGGVCGASFSYTRAFPCQAARMDHFIASPAYIMVVPSFFFDKRSAAASHRPECPAAGPKVRSWMPQLG